MNIKNKYKANILGSEYTIVASETEEYLEKLCDEVNKKMNEFSKANNLKPMKTSVLTAINFCDELIKAKETIVNLKNKIAEFSAEEEKLKREITALEEEKKYLKNVIGTNRVR